MTITTEDGLVAGLTAGQRFAFYKSALSSGGAAGVWASLWKQGGNPAAAANPPSPTGEIPTNSTNGALPFTNPSGANSAYLAQFGASCGSVGVIILYDRLWHCSQLDGTNTGIQTVNSLALTRPDAVGAHVEAWFECYATLGSTPRTLTVNYTDAVNGSGRTGTVSVPSSCPAQRMVPMTLQAGDSGVASIQSVQLSGSTGAIGNFGMTLLRRLVELPISVSATAADRDAMALGLPQLYSNSCLALMTLCSTSAEGPFSGVYSVAQG